MKAQLKDMKQIFNFELMQKHIDAAISELKANTELYTEDERANYIVNTLISSGFGSYACSEFIEAFTNETFTDEEKANENGVLFDEIDRYFEDVACEITTWVNLPSDFSLFIGFNESDCAIELYISCEVSDLIETE